MHFPHGKYEEISQERSRLTGVSSVSDHVRGIDGLNEVVGIRRHELVVNEGVVRTNLEKIR